MARKKQPKPPRWATRFLGWYCKPALYEDLQGDLYEYFERNVEKRSVGYAKAIYVLDVLKFFRSYTVQKPQILKRMSQFAMFSNYFKTSVRSMARSKLFTTINVAGLAVSMSVGLLLIALLYDIQHVDSFHVNKDRIYRLISKRLESNGNVSDFATSSVVAAKRVREEVPGVEKVVVLNSGVGGDAVYNERAVSFTGFWASEQFFEVFTFRLNRGNPATVLKAPNSVVLTESSAKKLFGNADPLGKTIAFKNSGPYRKVSGEFEYTVTGVMQDAPHNSHIQFDVLVSYITYEKQVQDAGTWGDMMSDNVYVLLDRYNNREVLEANLRRISGEENEAAKEAGATVLASAQAFNNIVPGPDLTNWRGPSLSITTVWILSGLAFAILLSACFNYTNLSTARSLRKAKEVGIRKVVGAAPGHIFNQLVLESILVSLLSLIISLPLFWLIRSEFLQLDEFSGGLVRLDLSPAVLAWFVAFSVVTGVAAGFIPALALSKTKSLQLSGKLMSHPAKRLGLRRALIVLQYVFSLAFITAAGLAYKQFHYSVNFDLGYNTNNVLNIDLQDNNPDVVIEKLRQLKEVEGIAQSSTITSTGYYWYTQARYLNDSLYVCFNSIDENYIPLLNHELLAGNNFHHMADHTSAGGVIVNEKFLERLNLGSPEEAVGKNLHFYGTREPILGVVKDFHYGTLESVIDPFIFRYIPRQYEVVNVKLKDGELLAAMDKIAEVWDEVDKAHPLKAEFYDKRIENVYQEYLTMVKVVGFLAFISLSIASLGLLGMVVFTTETRLKEISIRKVLGATEGSLLYLLSRGFLVLLLIAGVLAVPATTWIFGEFVLADVIYKAPVSIPALFAGVLFVLVLALVAISVQTLKAARTNPSNVLRSE